MKFDNLFAATARKVSLKDLADDVSEVAGIGSLEERYNEQFEKGHYFSFFSESKELCVMWSPGAEESDLPFWIQLRSSGEDLTLADDQIDLIGRGLTAKGFRVARIVNFEDKERQLITFPWSGS